MPTCENSWAGRLVIGLQLLSWCAVGALLLHRGISSVKHEDLTPTLNYSSMQTNLTATNDTQYVKSTTGLDPESKIADKVAVLKVNVHPKLTVSANHLDKQGDNTTDGEISTKPTPSSKRTPSLRHNVRVASSSDTRKNLILTPSGVVMAALGAIMLILGPSIVILRCCDAGSRGRFSKLYADDPSLALSTLDRPPAYDEVADDAPRYSTLFPDEDDLAVNENTTLETRAT